MSVGSGSSCVPGTDWPNGLPDEKYQVLVEDNMEPTTEYDWMPLVEKSEQRLEELLRRVYQFYVHKIPGKDVVCREELVYVVQSCNLQQSPWEATISVFSVWEQDVRTVKFKLLHH